MSVRRSKLGVMNARNLDRLSRDLITAGNARLLRLAMRSDWSDRLSRRCAGIPKFATSGDRLRPVLWTERMRGCSRARAG